MRLLRDLSLLKNNKGMSPLLTAVDEGNFAVFRLLLELTHLHDTSVDPAPNITLLPILMSLGCEKK
jgi:hypothetical protein